MHDAMSIFGVRERMRHHHDSSPLLIEFRPQLHDLLAHRGVAISGRLIGQAQLRTRHRRTGNRHALLLFSRKLLRPVLGPMRGLHILQGGVHARLAVPWRQVFVVKQGLLNVLEHGQIIDLVEALKDLRVVALSEHYSKYAILLVLSCAVPSRTGVLTRSSHTEALDATEDFIRTFLIHTKGAVFRLLMMKYARTACSNFALLR